jgi:putative transposase
MTEYGLSQRRSCGLVGLRRSTCRYAPRRDPARALRERLHALAAQRRRFGYRRLTVLLRREGLRNQRWAMDFMKDQLTTGRAFRVFNIVDEFSRKALASEVDTSLPGTRVVHALNRVADTRGTPEELIVDNGPEFIGKALDTWAWTRDVRLHFIDPGKPVQHAYIESFNGRFRDECLNESWFTTVADARATIEAWRRDYNTQRPHSSLGDLTPDEFEQLTINRAAEPTLSS